MPTKKRTNFFESEEGVRIQILLSEMENDSAYNTSASYSANSELYPDNAIPFVQKHMNYLNSHPNVDAYSYVSNLRLMTRIK